MGPYAVHTLAKDRKKCAYQCIIKGFSLTAR
jgi:hypothetical protein